jgi:hypothetical protein
VVASWGLYLPIAADYQCTGRDIGVEWIEVRRRNLRLLRGGVLHAKSPGAESLALSASLTE